MVEIKEVTRWYIQSGISHAVFKIQNWTQLGCKVVCCYMDYRELPTEPGKRICKKCREALKKATRCANPTETGE